MYTIVREAENRQKAEQIEKNKKIKVKKRAFHRRLTMAFYFYLCNTHIYRLHTDRESHVRKIIFFYIFGRLGYPRTEPAHVEKNQDDVCVAK